MEKSYIGWDLEQLEKLTMEDLDRSSDSDDESEDEVERMLPAPL
jgi:protein SHQ1